MKYYFNFQTREKIWNHEAAILSFSSVWKPDESRNKSFLNYFSNKENWFQLSFE